MRFSVCLFTLAVALSATARSQASVVITVGDASVVAGSGTVDLAVTISGGPIADFTTRFTVSDGTGTHMEFLSQPNPGSPTLVNPSYVFASDSADILTPQNFGAASGAPPYNTVFTSNDFTNSFANMVIGSSNNILAILRLTVPNHLSGDGNNTFTVSLDTTTSNNAGSSPITVFHDENSTIVAVDSSSTLSGHITITSGSTGPPTVVPEPSTFLGALLATGASLVIFRRCK